MSRTLKVAIVQEPAAVLDLAESVRRAERHIRTAAAEGAQLIAFPEVWLTCYPSWVFALAGWDQAEARHWYGRFVEESAEVRSEALDPVRKAARDAGVVVVLGMNERASAGSGSLYNSLLTLGTSGETLNVHRKLIPTHTERIAWRPSPDATGLRVLDPGFGRLGGLICWEHWQPLIRQTLHFEHEEVHVAAWPNVADIELLASRSYAFEGRCFVLAAAQYLTSDDVPQELHDAFRAGIGADVPVTGTWFTGGSGIVGPDGEWTRAPLRGNAGIIYDDLDLSQATAYKHDLDSGGHYSRADIFSLTVHREARPDVSWVESSDGTATRLDAGDRKQHRGDMAEAEAKREPRWQQKPAEAECVVAG